MMRWGIDGVVLIKMGGGARYGVALAIKKVTGKPIKFMGPGGELDGLGPFHPERVGYLDHRHGRCAHLDRQGRAGLRRRTKGNDREKGPQELVHTG